MNVRDQTAQVREETQLSDSTVSIEVEITYDELMEAIQQYLPDAPEAGIE